MVDGSGFENRRSFTGSGSSNLSSSASSWAWLGLLISLVSGCAAPAGPATATSAPATAPRPQERPAAPPPPTCIDPILDKRMNPNTNLDVSAYEPLVHEHALMGLARGEAFRDWLGGAKWTIDVANAALTVEGRGTFPIRVVGTFSNESNTFLWSWANEAITACAPKLYALERLEWASKQQGLAPFVERKLARDWVRHEELVAVLSDQTGLPWFQAPYGAGDALVLVEGVAVEPDIDLALVRRTIEASNTAIIGGKRDELVARFLRRAGYTVTATSPLRLDASKGDTKLYVEWTHGLGRFPTVAPLTDP